MESVQAPESIFSGKIFPKIYEIDLKRERIANVCRMPLVDQNVFRSEIEPAGVPIIFSLPKALSVDECLKELRRTWQDVILKVRVADYADPKNYMTNRKLVDMKLGQYLDEVLDLSVSLPPYAGNVELPEGAAERFGAHPPFYSQSDLIGPKFWIGAAGTITPLHKDPCDVFCYQIFGTKRWLLYPPKDAVHLRLKRVLLEDTLQADFSTSDIDFRYPSEEEKMEISAAQPIEVDINAGELFYLPAGWSHFVENISPSFMINYWPNMDLFLPGVLKSKFAG